MYDNIQKAGFNVYGFDLGKTLIMKTKEHVMKAGARVDLKIGDMLDLPYADSSFNCVYCHLLNRV